MHVTVDLYWLKKELCEQAKGASSANKLNSFSPTHKKAIWLSPPVMFSDCRRPYIYLLFAHVHNYPRWKGKGLWCWGQKDVWVALLNDRLDEKALQYCDWNWVINASMVLNILVAQCSLMYCKLEACDIAPHPSLHDKGGSATCAWVNINTTEQNWTDGRVSYEGGGAPWDFPRPRPFSPSPHNSQWLILNISYYDSSNSK